MSMVVRILGSSSGGNCYLFDAGGECLVVELGIGFDRVKRALGYDVGRIAGAIVTHEHGDHAGHVREALKCGLRVYALESVFKGSSLLEKAFARVIQPMRGYLIGGFKCFAFPVEHDVPCVGWVIEHRECGRCLFVTDTCRIDHAFQRVNHFYIECNYARDILEENISKGIEPVAMRNRLLNTHLDLDAVKEYLRQADLSEARDVTLIHLSSRNSDAARFVSEVSGVCGLPVQTADGGMNIVYGGEDFF